MGALLAKMRFLHLHMEKSRRFPESLLIIHRHGWQVFSNALGSHGTLSIFKISGSLTALFDIFSISLSEIVKQPVLAITALFGLAYTIGQKRWFLLSAFIITSLFSLESRRFIIVLGCIFSAIAIQSLDPIRKIIERGDET